MEKFNQKMSKAAVQREDLLAQKLGAATAEIKELEEEAEGLFASLKKLEDEKLKKEFHIRLLKDELEIRKTYPRGVPLGPSPEHLRKLREAKANHKRKEA
jgi:hypothetical protein